MADGSAPADPARRQARIAVSIVMPVRDADATLAATLESVLGQSDPDWELVAVDDGSTDGTATILAAYARRDARVRIVRAPRRGLVPALNAGLAAATGALIARLDADDVCLPDRLALQRRHLACHPGVGLVASRVAFGGDPVRAAGYARHVAWTNRLLSHEEISLARFVESPLAHPSVMFRREVVALHGGYADGNFPEDYELWLRWLEAGVRMNKLATTLLVWNDRPTRLSRCDPRYATEAFYRLKARYLARWLARHNRHHPAIVLWGAGRVTRRRAGHLLRHGIAIQAFVDIDPAKIGRTIGDRPIIDPARLPRAGRVFVVSYVGGRGAHEAIEAHLRGRGYRPGLDYVLAA